MSDPIESPTPNALELGCASALRAAGELVAFLRARYELARGNAEAATDAFLHGDRTGMKGLHPSVYRHIYTWTPARVLPEVEAKLRVLNRHSPVDGEAACRYCEGLPAWPCAEVRDLAAPFLESPDFKQEWVK